MATEATFLIFGTDYREMERETRARFAREGTRASLVCGESCDELRRSLDSSYTGSMLSPCSLIFTHVIPSKAGKTVTKRDVEAWVAKFKGSIVPSPQASGNPKIEWFAAKDTGEMTLMFIWNNVNADVCLRLAQATEDAFLTLQTSAGSSRSTSTEGSSWMARLRRKLFG